jgi:hypothetical protein
MPGESYTYTTVDVERLKRERTFIEQYVPTREQVEAQRADLAARIAKIEQETAVNWDGRRGQQDDDEKSLAGSGQPTEGSGETNAPETAPTTSDDPEPLQEPDERRLDDETAADQKPTGDAWYAAHLARTIQRIEAAALEARDELGKIRPLSSAGTRIKLKIYGPEFWRATVTDMDTGKLLPVLVDDENPVVTIRLVNGVWVANVSLLIHEVEADGIPATFDETVMRVTEEDAQAIEAGAREYGAPAIVRRPTS